MAHLEVKAAGGVRRVTLTRSAITIGRQPDNALVLPDDQTSRHHCIIEPSGEGFRIRDLGSSNGTRLNNRKVTLEELDNGDILRIGGVEVVFIDPDQQVSRRRRNTPDFHAAMEAEPPLSGTAPTIDLPDEPVLDAPTSYEQKLREIIDAAPEKPFDETDISLVDCRGSTVHMATSAGLDSGGEEDVGEGLRVFRLLLLACFRSRATDLHIEPHVADCAVRLRVDGFMLTAVKLSNAIFQRLLGIIKILCQIDTSRKNTVQDGHFSVAVKGRRVDYRVSLTPSVHGQTIVIRVLDSANAPSRLHELGLIPWMYDKLVSVAVRDAGFLLACGPTGSGKTTTLYSCIREIDVNTRNAITIEDPVEYSLEGCTQIPIGKAQDNSFATILRSVLRQDPDVIFVGEIRDTETATVAMQAAMTGHLVYSTVHSKDSIGAIFRLLDLGVEPYLVANALNLVLAQRLVRVLCPSCKKPVKPTPAQNMKMGRALDGVPMIYAPTGCKRCLLTGYIGRRAVFELLEFNEQMRDVVLATPTIQRIYEIARQGLFMTLQQFGYHLVARGLTGIEEIDRIAGSE